MKKIIFAVVGVFILSYLGNCVIYAEDDSRLKDAPYMSAEYLQYYISEHEIDVYHFKEYKKTADYVSKCREKPVFIKETAQSGKKPCYTATEEDTDLLYIGEMKGNKPHGTGTILQVIDLITDSEDSGKTSIQKYAGQSDEIYYARIYIDNFKKGRPEGYGIKFKSPADAEFLKRGIDLGRYYENDAEDIQSAVFDMVNPRIYEGGFKEGEYSGKGNEFYYIGLEDGTGRKEDSVKKKPSEGSIERKKEIEIYSGIYKNGRKNEDKKVS